MPRPPRAAAGGIVYHVMNRGNGRTSLFRTPEEYDVFVQLLLDGMEKVQVDLFGFCVIPNQWNLVLRPRRDRDLSAYLAWLTNTHVKRYRSQYPRTSGHLYQGRYKSFPVQENENFLTLLRYVEAGPLRAKLVHRSQDWQWSSLGCGDKAAAKLLTEWPIDRPRNWTTLVNKSLADKEGAGRVETSLRRGRPFGDDEWTGKMARRLNLQSTVNPRGRPRVGAPSAAKKIEVIASTRRN